MVKYGSTRWNMAQGVLRYGNYLTDDNKDELKYDLILANPPFSGSLDANDIAKSLSSTCSSKPAATSAYDLWYKDIVPMYNP